jgi:hypothetical protein
MKRKRSTKSRFSGTGLVIGFVSVLWVVLLSIYFFDQDNLDYEELEIGIILDDPKFYSKSEIAEWHTINTGIFKIQTPKEFKFFLIGGIDSYVAGLTNHQDTLFFDYGLYSNSLEDLSAPDFKVINTSIYNKNFRIVIGRSLDYIAAFTDELPNDNRLMIECYNCGDLDEKRKMIETIKIEKK